jgi:hypothetical protein
MMKVGDLEIALAQLRNCKIDLARSHHQAPIVMVIGFTSGADSRVKASDANARLTDQEVMSVEKSAWPNHAESVTDAKVIEIFKAGCDIWLVFRCVPIY